MKARGGLRTSWEAGAVLAITLLAAALRFYRLPEIPPGLHFDEAFKGVTARGLLAGDPLQLFFESDMGEEPLAMVLVAAALGLAGQEPWVVRLPSAIIGTLTVPLAWWLGRELFSAALGPPSRRRQTARAPEDAGDTARVRGQIVGLGTALVLALLYWHLSFSRIGMEPILVPFTATLAFAALAHGLNTGRWSAFALAGLALGGSLYTYKAGYFVPLLAILFVACVLVMERRTPRHPSRHHGRGLLLTAIVALVVAAPIVGYFLTHPANFLQRPASVALVAGESAQTSPWQALGENLVRVAGMFFWQGDANPRSNLPGRPALDPFLALLFLVGLGRALFETLRGRAMAALPLLWLGAMVAPTLITEHAPHFGRAIGATPALALLCALGGWTLWWAAAGLGRRWVEVAVALVLAAGLVFAGLSTARAYFLTWGHSPDLFYAYDVGLVEVAGYLNTRPEGEDVYLTPTSGEHYTLQYLVHRPLATFDGRAGQVYPPAGQAATILVLLREDGETLPALQQARPDGEVIWTLADDYGQPYAAAYHLPATVGERASTPPPQHGADAVFGAAARLLGYSLDADRVAPGGSVRLTLYWEALAPLDEDYTVFTHLLGEPHPATGGRLWAGHDGQPDGGHYPTTAWQPGQIILDLHPLTIPADAPAGEYQLEAGLYLLATLSRLPAIQGDGDPLPDDAALLGTVQVGE